MQKADRQYRQAQDLWEGAMPLKTCATDVVAQIQENFDIHVRPLCLIWDASSGTLA